MNIYKEMEVQQHPHQETILDVDLNVSEYDYNTNIEVAPSEGVELKELNYVSKQDYGNDARRCL